MSDCIFCKIVKKELPGIKLYEDEEVLAFMDIQPINPGHLLIIPKKHSALISDVEDSTVSKMSVVAVSYTHLTLPTKA
jgi:histidine triad (HIT) family protein